MSGKHKIGLVVPQAQDHYIPPEGAVMYPDVTFISRGSGVRSLTPEGYDAAVDKLVPAAESLAREGAEAVMVIGTSLTFYRGAAFHDELLDRLRKATGLPCSTMSKSIVDGLKAVGATKVAVSTAYNKVVNDKLVEWLEARGFEVEALTSLGITEFGAATRVSDTDIIDLAEKARAGSPTADGILISCGGLRTLNVADPLEKSTGLPVVSSMQSAFWAALGLVGETGRLSGYGRMLERDASKL